MASRFGVAVHLYRFWTRPWWALKQEDDAGRYRRRPLMLCLRCLAVQADREGLGAAKGYRDPAVFGGSAV